MYAQKINGRGQRSFNQVRVLNERSVSDGAKFLSSVVGDS